MRKGRPRLVASALALGAVVCLGCAARVPEFAAPSPDRPVIFPRDHYAHPGFATEWWYYTGHVSDEAGREFGFQLVFFRRHTATDRRGIFPVRWYADPIYFAHFAVTDLATGAHRDRETYGRELGGQAGARTDFFHVWIDDWVAQEIAGYTHLRASMDDCAIDLALRPEKPPVVHGEAGVSRKGVGGGSSYYISTTRLAVSGSLTIDGRPRTVRGEAWTDHEILSQGMSEKIRGWDWLSIQLSNGTELMLFHLRCKDGSVDPLSAGTFVRADGSFESFLLSDFRLEPTGHWTSPASFATYPAAWRIAVPRFGIELEAAASVPDQEVRAFLSGLVYWEGSIRVRGTVGEDEVTGRGYAELTGYAKPVKGL